MTPKDTGGQDRPQVVKTTVIWRGWWPDAMIAERADQ